MIKLDPRTKLIMVIVGIAVTYLGQNVLTEIVFVSLFLIPFIFSKSWKKGLRAGIFYVLSLITAYYILPLISHRAFYYMLSFFSIGLRVLQTTFIPAIFTLSTTPTREWVALLKRWNAPHIMIMTVSVMGRFGPTVKEDYYKIRQAMAFRGIGTSFFDLLKKPIESFEYIIVPLLMNATQVAEDLTISALTKGLTLKRKQTSIVQLKMQLSDYIYIGILVIALYFFVFKGGF